MDDSYTPFLKMFGERSGTNADVLFWILLVVLGFPVLLFFVNYIRDRIRTSQNRVRGLENLEMLGDRNGLDYLEQQTLEHIVEDVGLKNPALLLSSIEMFDRTVGAWMGRLQQGPWLKMLMQVDRLQSIRKKVGYRYLAVGHPPTTTRELRLGQKLYMLIPSKEGFRLLSAPIIDLDDLAIHADLFSLNGRPVRLKEHRDILVFFWSDVGGEYLFKTRVLQTIKRPAPYLMLQQGDSLISEKGRKVFSCDMEMEVTAAWSHTLDERRVAPKSGLESDTAQTLAGCLVELSGSGFSMTTDIEVGFNDLVQLDGGVPDFLQGATGRVADASGPHIRFKFQNLSAESREAILAYITPRISADGYRKVTAKKVAKR
jgi:hypothetical protein